MYIQITNRCNMSCEHCCFDCSLEGDDISLVNFKKAIALTMEVEDYLTIGGGEPTIHPRFLDILKISIAHYIKNMPCFETPIHIITNGSQDDIMLFLYGISSQNDSILGVSLSRDLYHEPISETVKKLKNKGNFRVKDQPRVAARGRASDWGEEYCACSDILIDPKGVMRFCGCEDSEIIGNISDKKITEKLVKVINYKSEKSYDCVNQLDRKEFRKFVGI